MYRIPYKRNRVRFMNIPINSEFSKSKDIITLCTLYFVRVLKIFVNEKTKRINTKNNL